ncbi:MAG TPA: DUF2946 family protein [Bradyrhizobium sp.]|nr:DUF2946 family protein [Bradyrhizobium sp.]
MRGRYHKFLPLVLIALLLQVLAPVAACWAAAAVLSDPLAAAEICHSDPGALSAQGNQNSDHARHGGSCWICCAAQSSASFDAPRLLAFAVPYRQAADVTWRDAALQLRALPAGTYAQARAPPALS